MTGVQLARDLFGDSSIAYKSAWTVNSKWGFVPLPSPHKFSVQETARILELCQLTNNMYVKASTLMSEAVQTGEPKWLYKAIFSCFESGSEEADLAKEAIIRSAGASPRIVRLDVLGTSQVCEYQVPGAAWGPVSALESLYGTGSHQTSLVELFRRRLRGKSGLWWIYQDANVDSMNFLCSYLAKHGIEISVVHNGFDFVRDGSEIVLKRKHFLPMLQDSNGKALVRLWLEGRIEIDPQPHIAEDTKLAYAMMWHPDTYKCFTDDERRIAVPSILIENREQKIRLDTEADTLEFKVGDLLADELTPGLSKTIIKYAGNRPGDMLGGHAVFALNHVRGKVRKQIVSRALEEYQDGGHPWIIQPFSSPKSSFSSFSQPSFEECREFWKQAQVTEAEIARFADNQAGDARYYTLLRPTYGVDETGNVYLGPCGILMRKSWKVHGTSDTAQGLCLPNMDPITTGLERGSSK